MKKWFLYIGLALFIGVFVSSAGIAQQSIEDVVYLKNGSIIHGTIIEQVPGVSIKIETRDGNVFVYKMDEVAKITKEPAKERMKKEKEEVQKEKSGGSHLDGKLDGEMAGNSSYGCMTGGVDFGAGCLFGILGYAFYFLVDTEPSDALTKSSEDKSSEYKIGFREGYASKRKNKFLTYCTAGFLIQAVIGLTMLSASGGGF